jgi:hypothetical protein
VVGSGVYFLADREKKQPFNIPDKGGQKQYQLLFLIKTRTIILSIKVDNALVPIYKFFTRQNQFTLVLQTPFFLSGANETEGSQILSQMLLN